MKTFWALTVGVMVLATAGMAAAGTATMDFSTGTGLMTHKFSSGSGVLGAQGGRAHFTGSNTTLLARDGAPVTSISAVTATMTLSPYYDATNLMGIVIFDSHDSSSYISALCSSDGMVTLTDVYDNYRTKQFSYPAAYNNSLSVSYNPSTGRATLSLNGGQAVFLDDALAGATSIWVGVTCGGVGGFDNLVIEGNNIPDYPPADRDGDGATDQEETTAGTDPDDPGSRPVGALGATVTDTSGISVTFPAGALTSTVNVELGATGSLPAGGVPGGLTLGTKAAQLEPNNTVFAAPVTVTLPYQQAEIAGIEEAGLTALYFDGANYASNGIAGVTVNTAANTLTFTTTHFTLFALAGPPTDTDDDGTPDFEDDFPYNPFGQTDTDSDGIGDEWEDAWFGNLTTVNAGSDRDSDGVSDVEEFHFASFGTNPTDGATQVPVGGMAAAIAGILIVTAGRKRLTRG